MPDSTVSNLAEMSVWSANDLVLVIDVGTTNVSKNATLKNFSEKALQNTVINGTFRPTGNAVFQGTDSLFQSTVSCNNTATFRRSVVVANNKIQIANTITPVNSNTSMGGKGIIGWDASYLYIQVTANTVKRVALSSW